MREGRYQDAWAILAGMVDHAPPEIVVKAKAFCALGLAQSLERNRSLFGTDWAEVVTWRRIVTELAPENLHNWALLVMALLYGDQSDAARALLAQADETVAAHLRQATGAALEVVPALRRSTDCVYRREAPRYLRHGVPVVPCFGTIAIFDGWRNFAGALPNDALVAEWSALEWAQIGAVLGPCSGLAVLDIDAGEPELVAAVLEALPASPWQRPGSPGMAMAFRRSDVTPVRGRLPDRRPVFGLLGDGRRLILPPSMDPHTGGPYSATVDLTEVAADLPALPEDYAERIVHAAAKRGFTVELQQVK
jgi:hypothetical protein